MKSIIYKQLHKNAVARVETIKMDNLLDAETTMGDQASNEQLEQIKLYLDIGKQEGAGCSAAVKSDR